MNARAWAAGLAAILLMAGAAQAAITIDTVTVGNPGNVGELSGAGAGGYGYGPDRICGAVGYDYRIGKYEVTAGQYTVFLNAVAKTDTYGLYNAQMADAINWWGCNIQRSGSSGSYTYSVATDWANRPVNYVSWGDSARFANWLHNGQPTGGQDLTTTEDGAYYLNGATSNSALLAVRRKDDATWAIPTEDEWYKAAYYNSATCSYYDYPTSSDTAPGRDMADASGNNANYYTGSGAYPIDSGKYTTIVGEFQNSDSPYGTFDQGGNVSEWNESIIDFAWPDYAHYRGIRGGSFGNSLGGFLLALNRSYNGPVAEGAFVGFRVSEVPEPASMAVLALGSIGMLLRRRGLKR